MKKYIINQPERFQWFNNNGYCGETSLIASGLMYGQYISQYYARSLIGTQSDQVLLGENAHIAAEAMHLSYIQKVSPQGDNAAFLAWVKSQVMKSFPVIIGVYTNERKFYGSSQPSTAGQSSYDHIVPVLGIASTNLHSFLYNPEDHIIFSDNGLKGSFNSPSSVCDSNPKNPYLFEYEFDTFSRTREEANHTSSPWYSLASDAANYGLVVTGIEDPNKETIPISITTKCGDRSYVNYEYPQVAQNTKTKLASKPNPMPLILELTLTIPDPKKSYTLYLYDDLSKVPTQDFHVHSTNATKSWVINSTSSTHTMDYPISSDDVAIFRAVANT